MLGDTMGFFCVSRHAQMTDELHNVVLFTRPYSCAPSLSPTPQINKELDVMFSMPSPKAPGTRTMRRKKRVEKKMIFDMQQDEVSTGHLWVREGEFAFSSMCHTSSFSVISLLFYFFSSFLL